MVDGGENMKGLGPGARLIIGVGILLLGGVFCPIMLNPAAVAEGTVTIELLKAFGSVAAGTVANAIDVLIGKKNSDHVSLENQNLTKAVGKAIATVIGEAANKRNDDIGRKLKEIAQQAESNWVKIAQQELYPQLREAKLDQFLTPEEYHLTQEGNLSVEDWKNIFDQLCKLHQSSCAGQTSDFYDMSGGIITYSTSIKVDSDFQLPLNIFSDVANLLHKEFPKALRETFKKDFKQDGKAFAGLILQLLTGMKAEINKQGNQQTAEFAKILQRINEVEPQLKGTPEQIQQFFTKLSKDIEVNLAEIREQLVRMEYKQDENLVISQKILQNTEKLLQSSQPFPSSNPPIKPDCKNNPLPNDNSDFYYIERPPLEKTCYEAVEKPGGLIRIKAPKKMGKTLLLNKILNYAKNKGYKTVNLQFSDPKFLENYETCFKTFCSNVSVNLNIEDKTNEYWIKYQINGSFTSAKFYFQNYLLSTIETNLVIGLNHFQIFFSFQKIFERFCALLRDFHDFGKSTDEIGQIWRKLRIVIVNSTEKYPELNINHSPFNVGVDINERIGLRLFTETEAKKLLDHYQLEQKLNEQDFKSLITLVGGHPYLIQQAFAYLKKYNEHTISELFETASTEQGEVFIEYLRELLNSLEENDLKESYKKVLTESNVKLDSTVGFKLHSLGLIKFSGNYAISSCDLYTKYFSEYLVYKQTKIGDNND